MFDVVSFSEQSLGAAECAADRDPPLGLAPAKLLEQEPEVALPNRALEGVRIAGVGRVLARDAEGADLARHEVHEQPPRILPVRNLEVSAEPDLGALPDLRSLSAQTPIDIASACACHGAYRRTANMC